MSDQVIGNLTEDHQRINGSLTRDDANISGSLSPRSQTLAGNLDGSGSRNYNHLYNKPKIEGVTLEGDLTFEELNLMKLSNADLARILT